VRVLLDEMLPVGVAQLLPGHDVTTVKAAGFTGLNNGELVRRAAAAGYDVLLTADRNLPEQQNLGATRLAVVLVPGNRVVEIEPRSREIDEAIRLARPGTVARLGRAD
jgi:hypothetical protein